MKSSHFSFNPNLGACVCVCVGEGGEGRGGGRGGAGGFYHPSWVSLNNSETVKAVTLAFCSIQLLFIRDIRAKFGNPNLRQSPDVGQNPDEGISDFRIPDQSCKNENYHDYITTHDNDMKVGPVTAIEKKNAATTKKLTMTSCWQIVTSLSFARFMANLQSSGSPISDTWSVKLTFPLTVTVYLTKPGNRTKKSPTQLSYYCFE